MKLKEQVQKTAVTLNGFAAKNMKHAQYLYFAMHDTSSKCRI